jgi:hypothetical protein
VITILIWFGSGFAFSIGILVGLFILNRTKPTDGIGERSVEMLEERNRLTQETNGILREIRASIIASRKTGDAHRKRILLAKMLKNGR